MPIKDLSDTVRLPRLGKIHLGTRDPERGFPRKSEFFVFPKDHSDYGKLVEAFGEEPKELRILIPVEDEEQWATQYYRAYNQTQGMVCKGDGDTAMRMVDTKTGTLPGKSTATVELREMVCDGRSCPEYKAKKCHEVMNLRFILPEVPGLGIWQIDTGSINSILNINSCATIIKRAFGRISLIPLKLTFEPIQVNNPETGKKQTVYVLNLRTDVTIAQLADVAREQAKTLMITGADLEAAWETEVEKNVEELWPEDKKPAEVEQAPVETAAKTVHKPASKGEYAKKSEPKEGPFPEKEPPPEPEPKAQEEAKTEIPTGMGKVARPDRDPESIRSLVDLFKACHADFGMQPAQVVKELGYTSKSDITDLPSICYSRIVAFRCD